MFKIIILVCLVSSAFAAPTDTTTEAAPATTTTSGTTTTSPPTTTTTSPPTSTSTATTTKSPGPDEFKEAGTGEDSLSDRHNRQANLKMNASSFTCYGRTIGYYADPEQDCKVYHFCLLGHFNNEPVYQRISYLCLKGTFFDQQALDCVDTAKLSGPCSESANHYEVSNSILRQSIIAGDKFSGVAEKPIDTTDPTL